MGKLGKGVHTTGDGDRIFVGPDVPRYPTEEGGEVVIVEPDSEASEETPEEE
jgi:hypothetical protein